MARPCISSLIVLMTILPLSAADLPPLQSINIPPDVKVGRFHVVRAGESEIILLDTATGKLYRATPKDYLPLVELFGQEAEKKPAPKAGALRLPGQIVPGRVVRAYPQLEGRIEKLFVAEGDNVKQGDLLAAVEVARFGERVNVERARLEAAEARLKELKAGGVEELNNLLAVVQRTLRSETGLKEHIAELEKRAKLAATPATATELEKGRKELSLTRNRLTALQLKAEVARKAQDTKQLEKVELDVKAAEHLLRLAKLELDACAVRSPDHGVVVARKREVGSLVKTDSVLFEIADLRNLEVELAVHECDLSSIRGGQSCTIVPQAFEKVDPFRKRHPDGYAGEVSALSSSVDPATATTRVRVKVRIPDDEGVYLRPGMSVTVAFKLAEK